MRPNIVIAWMARFDITFKYTKHSDDSIDNQFDLEPIDDLYNDLDVFC